MDAITEVPESHWRPEDYFDSDPKASDRTYAQRGGFLTPVDFPLLEFGIARTRSRRPTPPSSRPDGGPAGPRRRRAGTTSAVGPRPRQRHPRRDRHAGTGHSAGRPARPSRSGGGPSRRPASTRQPPKRSSQRIADSYVGWQENSFPGLLGNVAAGRIANRLDLGGTNCVVDAACASSLGAVNLALLELAAGRCDIAVTGGIDTFNDIFMYMCFSKTPALSPTGDARPFDAEADGTILGEGLGVLVLKRLADARRDGDRIYAVIRSIGTSSDGKGQAVYAPERRGPGEGAAAGLRVWPGFRRRRSSWSRPTAPEPRSATRPSWRRCERFTRSPGRRPGVRWARSNRRSAIPRRRRERRA